MAGIFQNALRELTQPQIDFLCRTFCICQEALLSADEAYLDTLYDDLCDMEVAETDKAGNKALSEDGQYVSDIVTVLGNAIAEAEGYWEEE